MTAQGDPVLGRRRPRDHAPPTARSTRARSASSALTNPRKEGDSLVAGTPAGAAAGTVRVGRAGELRRRRRPLDGRHDRLHARLRGGPEGHPDDRRDARQGCRPRSARSAADSRSSLATAGRRPRLDACSRTQYRGRRHGGPAAAHRRRRQRPREREHDGLQAPARRVPRPRLRRRRAARPPRACAPAPAPPRSTPAAPSRRACCSAPTARSTSRSRARASCASGCADGREALTRDGGLHVDGARQLVDQHRRARAAGHHDPRGRRRGPDLDRPRRHRAGRRPARRQARRRHGPLAPRACSPSATTPSSTTAASGPAIAAPRATVAHARARSRPPTPTWPRRWSR